jgi:hypothetical protein
MGKGREPGPPLLDAVPYDDDGGVFGGCHKNGLICVLLWTAHWPVCWVSPGLRSHHLVVRTRRTDAETVLTLNRISQSKCEIVALGRHPLASADSRP